MAGAAPAVRYEVVPLDLAAHLWQVTVHVAKPSAEQTLSLPVWLAGSYMVREFSKHLQCVGASQGTQAAAIAQVSKNTWSVACNPKKALTVHYQVYAFDASVRTAWLCSQRGFFNATSLCLRVHGQDEVAQQIDIQAPTRALRGGSKATPWSLFTGLAPLVVDGNGFGSYTAADYDELADCPVEMGHVGSTHWMGAFEAGGIRHRFVISGALASTDCARMLADTKTICEAIIGLWDARGKPPMRSYGFFLNAVDDGYGGLEHRNSTALICKRADLPRLGGANPSDGYTTLLGLISHEYFHTWNVKRLRPFEMARYDFEREQYTELLWFFEGFTSYYDDLMLRRAGLIDDATYLGLLQKTLRGVLQGPGRGVQTVAESSFNAWIKSYRQDENSVNAIVSYYTKGSLVALCFDLTLRAEGRTTLDLVMRALWQRCKGGPMREADFAQCLADLGGRSFAQELQDWVHSTSELPVERLLSLAGVAIKPEDAPLTQRLGLRVNASEPLRIRQVIAGSPAMAAGFAAGDEWVCVTVEAPPTSAAASSKRAKTEADNLITQGNGTWRMQRLDDVSLYAGTAPCVVAWVSRDKRMLNLDLRLDAGFALDPKLSVGNAEMLARWLS